MSKNIGSLAITITANAARLQADLNRAQQHINKFASSAATSVNKTAAAFNTLGKTVGGMMSGMKSALGGLAVGLGSRLGEVGSLIGLIGFAGGPIAGLATAVGAAVGWGGKLAADAEQAQIAFSVMLGSTSRATEMMSFLSKFAADTPFALPELTQATKSLLAFGVAADDIPKTLRMLGDVGSGMSIPITEMADLFGRNAIPGMKLLTKDIREFAGRGIPILEELSKMFNVGAGDILGEGGLASTGAITAQHLIQVFERLTGEGGRFSGMMAKQAQSTLGLWSTVVDTAGIALRDVGALFIERFDIKGLMRSFIDTFNNASQTIVPVVEGMLDNVLPLFRGFWGVASAGVGMVIDAFKQLGNVVNGLFGGNINWTQVLVEGLIKVEFFLRNLGDIGAAMFQGLIYEGIKWKNEFVHFLTATIPEALSWFADNWSAVFMDVYNGTITMFKNLGANMWRAITFKKMLPLFEGFQWSEKTNPAFSKRQLGADEIKAYDLWKKMEGRLDDDFGAFRQSRMDSIFAGEGAKFARQLASVGSWLGGLWGQASGTLAGLFAMPKVGTVPGAGQRPKLTSALEMGSKEAVTAIAGWMMDQSVQPIDKQQLAAMNGVRDELVGMAKDIAMIARNLTPFGVAKIGK